ncbi:MAG: exodeoxyribonuclease III, partial [Anaerolineales bacterium]|nr:exodeoxyribonuclease III [Anaerolineales bacterium]
HAATKGEKQEERYTLNLNYMTTRPSGFLPLETSEVLNTTEALPSTHPPNSVIPTSEVSSVCYNQKMFTITTWNANGLRAALKNGANTWWENYDPDLLCLQEVRARPDQLTDAQREALETRNPVWNPAERPGYSGVATFAKDKPTSTEIGLGIPRFDQQGRVIQTLLPGIRIYNIYFPNGGRGLSRVGYKLDFYQELLEICDQQHQDGEKIIICGDFNTCHQPIDLRNPKANEGNTGFLPEEREWIDIYLDHGFKDIFRELYPEKEQYSWWTFRGGARERNVGWRLDYFLISDALVDQVEDVIIHDQVMGSDHCPVSLLIDLT